MDAIQYDAATIACPGTIIVIFTTTRGWQRNVNPAKSKRHEVEKKRMPNEEEAMNEDILLGIACC